MADNVGDIPLLWRAFGGLASVVGAGFLFLFGYTQRGKAALWAAVNANARAAADGRLEDSRLYATGDDVKELGERLEKNIQQSEARIMEAIRDRPPVRGAQR